MMSRGQRFVTVNRRRRFLAGCLLAVLLSGSASIVSAADIQTSIFVMDVDGSNVRRVARIGGSREHGSPRWSHDGQWIAFDRRDRSDHSAEVFVASADGSQLRKVADGAWPDWSPDDRQLVYAYSGGEEFRPGIWSRNLDGGERLWVALGSGPRWSPDGSRLALANEIQIQLLDLAEGFTRHVLKQPFRAIEPGFDWSPDGKRLAFVGANDETPLLWIVDAEAAEEPLSPRASGELGGTLSWSPDGKQIAVSLGGRIQLIEANTSGEPRLIPGQRTKNFSPAWSPSGKQIAFSGEVE